MMADRWGPAVSVLMPVRNGAAYLSEAIASLAAQTFRDFEIVVIDNGSTDATPQLLCEWAKREPRLRSVRIEGPRLTRSLNLAAKLARAPLLARLDADDVALPHRLERQVAAMAANPGIGLLGSNVELIDGRGRRLGRTSVPVDDAAIRHAQRTSCVLAPSSTIIRADLFRKVGGYRPGLNISEDFDLWSRLAEHCELAALPDLLVRFRVHRGSVTARQPRRMALAAMCVVAACEARRRGEPEPFAAGSPNLRRALPLLGLSRAEARRVVAIRSRVNMAYRLFLGLPLPIAVKTALPGIVGSLGVRRLYQAWLRWAHRRQLPETQPSESQSPAAEAAATGRLAA
jgi:cellulose synthase/poly-beta-1,6-N-acetylglucosamine synthase-like glycosyltransferase